MFRDIKKSVQKQIDWMLDSGGTVCRVDVPGEEAWDTYLYSFKRGTDPIYRERTEHDCSCCRSFIKSVGNMIVVKDGEVHTIWDGATKAPYKVVTKAMSTLMRSAVLNAPFFVDQQKIGTDKNRELLDSGEVNTYEHFYYKFPNRVVQKGAGERIGQLTAQKNVLHRGLQELTLESMDIVLELIDQKSLYKGDEYKHLVAGLRRLKIQYDKEINKNTFCWEHHNDDVGRARVRNTAIGTLLIDLSNGVELDRAVTSFENMVAPQNYKRTSMLITKGMVDKAKKKAEQLGVLESFPRRFATLDDIPINEVLFTSTSNMAAVDVFDVVRGETIDKPNLKKVEEVDVDVFINNILPKAEQVEVYFDNQHVNNLVSMVAPENADAPSMFKWDNAFSWSYNGDYTDSIKERVKKAGGKVDGWLRVSLSWFNRDDLDLHVYGPGKKHVYFSNQTSSFLGCSLDVDMNAGSLDTVRDAVENIVWPTKNGSALGRYTVKVHNYTKRESKDTGFNVEMEVDDVITTFSYSKAVKDKEYVPVIDFKITEDGIVIEKQYITGSSQPLEKWGLKSKRFHKVNSIMHSPNCWEETEVGHKHLLFMIDDCHNPDQARGFFNEYLHNAFIPYRKVFDMLGSKSMAEPVDNQLSGLGFSTTKRTSVICRITGSFNRTIKVNF